MTTLYNIIEICKHTDTKVKITKTLNNELLYSNIINNAVNPIILQSKGCFTGR